MRPAARPGAVLVDELPRRTGRCAPRRTEARGELLARIAAGEAATVALDLSATTASAAVCVTAVKDGDSWRLSGKVRGVPDLPVARIVLVPARTDGGTDALFLLEREGEAPRLNPAST